MRHSALALFLILAPSLLLAGTIQVPADQPTIQAGIDAASAGDTVLVACGTYYEHDIEMKSGISLLSETGDSECVTIDATSSGRIMSCEDLADLTSVIGITFANGYTEEDGGGVKCHSTDLLIDSCQFIRNWAGYGGGLSCTGYSSLSVITSSFIENASDVGGAILANRSSVWINGCTFSYNSTPGFGGAIHGQSEAAFTIESSLFSFNVATWGGGISLYGSSAPVNVIGCVFERNVAEYGGGVSHHQGYGSTTVTNTTFALNSALQGGAIEWEGLWSDLSLNNCIFAYSIAGEAISCDVLNLEVICCNVYGNAGGDWVGCIDGWIEAPGNISEDPLFCNPNLGEYDLASGSPCLPLNNDCEVLIGALGEGDCSPTGVEDAPSNARVELFTFPNPFNPHLTITFVLPADAQGSLVVHDVSGRQVRVLMEGPFTLGTNEVVWNGQDDHGQNVASGVYFVRLMTGEHQESKKVVLLR
jgi:predicted outer membrane repeat protein